VTGYGLIYEVLHYDPSVEKPAAITEKDAPENFA
jgi:hypothetical protein